MKLACHSSLSWRSSRFSRRLHAATLQQVDIRLIACLENFCFFFSGPYSPRNAMSAATVSLTFARSLRAVTRLRIARTLASDSLRCRSAKSFRILFTVHWCFSLHEKPDQLLSPECIPNCWERKIQRSRHVFLGVETVQLLCLSINEFLYGLFK